MLCLLLLCFDLVVVGLLDFFFFVPALHLSILILLFLPSFVSLSYFFPAVSVSHARVFGKTLVHEFHFPIAILNSICFFPDSLPTSAQCVFGANK